MSLTRCYRVSVKNYISLYNNEHVDIKINNIIPSTMTEKRNHCKKV